MNDLIDNETVSSSQYLAEFWEGVILAANMSPKPLTPEQWIEPLIADIEADTKQALVTRFEQQYAYLMVSDYDLFTLLKITLTEPLGSVNTDLVDHAALQATAQGFMSIWPVVENGWDQAGQISDGSVRMLQALLTTFMLIVDQEQTQQQMQAAGITEVPCLKQMLPQLNLMINEVAHSANELMQGKQAQYINPYKGLGRNDPCPCDSGKKFKQCCGKL
ncbi:UPF0149 family protein [Vibrio sp. S11_S32]|uniref:YecA family protein n=1 Tax=Vibrio sp. S11_S32 TaxID=2720225 RepID=UPI001680F14B|nr:SEC-C metal-binding domain-containing protein [Vibrio sp. S11_S32]MBD1575493.1 UPF0149 family protein [Vibrio sp. S11_S32]